MKRSGGGEEEGAGGRIGNGSFFGAAAMVMSSSSPSSSISDNSSNRNLMQQQQTALESPTSRLGCLSLQHQEQEQEERERQQQQQCVVASSSTTFVHVDTCNFREVVQKLTGASEHDGLEKFPVTLPARQAARAAAAAAAGGAGAGTDKLSDITCKGLIPKPVGDLSARRPASFKLHERRQAFLLRSLDVKDLRLSSSLRRGSSGYGSGFCSPTSEVSPRFNSSLMPSPVTPLTSNVFDNNAYGCNNNTSNSYTSPGPREKHGGQEELQDGDDAGRRPTPVESRDGRFMLHSSPPTLEKPRRIPELLTLFPLTSPRASEPPT
ncbi:unnamed protein product [Sphagnum balticum]